jgi:N-acetylglucosaminyldiphosphoundecaprenol N-acetyl-beta-D-mannosaminyltransferase
MPDEFRRILGIRFYTGDFAGLLDLTMNGGLITVPSAPVLVDLANDPAHREALERCDFAITDSGFMVMLWFLFHRERLPRISGLRFMRGLLERQEFRQPAATFWVMPSEEDARANREWLRQQGIPVAEDDCYVAPFYPAGSLDDPALLARIERRRPRFVVLCIRGGVQERLGYGLRQHLPYRPTIVCTGAAIAFLSGQQTNIPGWADRFFLGWLIRSLSHPRSFPPRLWKALRLAALIPRYGSRSVTE